MKNLNLLVVVLKMHETAFQFSLKICVFNQLTLLGSFYLHTTLQFNIVFIIKDI